MNLKLSAPSQVIWIIALILGIVGILGFLGIVAVGAYAFWLVVVGWALLVFATMMRNM